MRYGLLAMNYYLVKDKFINLGIFLHIYIFSLLLFLKKAYTFLKWPWPSNPIIMSSNVIFSRVLLVHWAHLFPYHLKCLLCDEHFVILIETFRNIQNTKHTDIRQAVVCIFIYIYGKKWLFHFCNVLHDNNGIIRIFEIW